MLAWWLVENHDTIAEGTEHAHEAAGHAAEHGGGIPELPNIFGVAHHLLGEYAPGVADRLDNLVAASGISDPMVTPFQAFENLLFALLVILGLWIFFYSGYKRLRRKPPTGGNMSKRALFSEIIVLFFDDFFGQIFGRREVRKHLPFVGTLFIYILALNCLGLVFLGKSPTANLSFNLGMATLVFLYVHITGISRSPMGYLAHYPGSLPSFKELPGPMGWILIPFMFILFTIIHILEAIIQPVSLSLRLFGNILGKEVLLGVFGSLLVAGAGVWAVGIPLHTPFLFLGLLLGAIQALIFSLLSAVYITLWLPHEHAEEH